MKKVILQYWEESERGWGIRPDGCSLHIDINGCKDYINKLYELRDDSDGVPNEYERIVGDPIEVLVKDEIYDMVMSEKTVRLLQASFSNLLKFEEIIP